MPDHIDPSAIPGDNLRPDMVEIAGSEISSIGDEVSDQGGVVVTTWQRLAQHYEAPEAGTLFGVMDPVKTNAETFGNNVDRVSSALKTYAAEVEPIKAELAKIKAEAYSFVASIAGGVEKTTFSRAGAITSTVEWHEDQDSVDANNDLIRRVNAQMVLLWAAERKCANAIYDIIGFPHIEAATEDNPNGYGVTEIPDGAETPWGKAVERSESCGEKAVDAVGRFVWDGVIVGGIWGTVVGLGTLTLGYNPQTGEWFDGDTYGAAWSNLGKLAVGLAVTSLPGTLMIANMPGPAGNFLRESQMTVLNAGKGFACLGQVEGRSRSGRRRGNVQRRLDPHPGWRRHRTRPDRREHGGGCDSYCSPGYGCHRPGVGVDQGRYGWREDCHSSYCRSGEVRRSVQDRHWQSWSWRQDRYPRHAAG